MKHELSRMKSLRQCGLGLVVLCGWITPVWAHDAAAPGETVPMVCTIIKKQDGTYTCANNASSGRWRIGPGAATCTQQIKPIKRDEVCPQVWEPADWAGRPGF